ncbi:tyrosine-type recombinase/integrase [Brevundimonas sp.]|uniref:tyrosine-type recombinase/integrase n=1 Tax=Brevundimonas sp. TaxID=1871086 RepID=UPI00289C8307|nr:integrase arm-type DNA-binding domain-containing protein [Brevundimonas sp.]
MAVKLTDRVAASIRCPKDKRTHVVADIAGNGLVLSVSKTGRRFWKFRYDYGRRRNDMMTIGEFPLVSYDDAKAEAARLQRMVKIEKRDPKMVAYQPKTATTVEEAIDAWLLAHPHRNTPTIVANFKPLREKFGNINLADLSRHAVKDWAEEEYGAKGNRPNRGGACVGVLASLNAVVNWALRETDTGVVLPPHYRNPFSGLSSRLEAVRERVRVGHAVNWEVHQFRQILRGIEWTHSRQKAKNGWSNALASNMCLVTGARPSEIVSLRWDEIDTVTGQPGIRTITKNRHKTWLRTGRPRVITMGQRGIDILNRCRKIQADNGYIGPWVFPSPQPARKGLHVKCINHYCRTLSKKIGFEVRPYNFRSAYINHSLEAAEGQGSAAFNATLQMVAENVGHTKVSMTLGHYVKAKTTAVADSVMVADKAFDRYDEAA